MMSLCAIALGLDETFFADKIDRHITAMRINHYPQQTVSPLSGQLRAGAHTDYGMLTILNGENKPGGLQVLTRSGDWIDVETDPDTFVVNIGDLLELWSGGYFMSTPHKVVNTSGKDRFSFPFFIVPRHDVVVTPLIDCQPGFERATVPVGPVSREVWRTNWPEAVPEDTGFDLGTLPD